MGSMTANTISMTTAPMVTINSGSILLDHDIASMKKPAVSPQRVGVSNHQLANASVRSEGVVNAQSGASLFKLACVSQFHFAVLCVQHSAFAEGIVHAKLIAFMAFVTSDGVC